MFLPILAMLASVPQGAGLPGTWRGTSTCVDKSHFPACTDEVVIYEAHAPHGARGDSVTIAADKVVAGAREPMGELEYARQSDGSWVAEFQNGRVHIRLTLHLAADHIAGAMTDVITGRQVRRITLDRSR